MKQNGLSERQIKAAHKLAMAHETHGELGRCYREELYTQSVTDLLYQKQKMEPQKTTSRHVSDESTFASLIAGTGFASSNASVLQEVSTVSNYLAGS